MTELVDQDDEDTASAEVVVRNDQAIVLRLPLRGSCAVPLSVEYPRGLTLLTWAYEGFSGLSIADPCCLLVLSHQGGSEMQFEEPIVVRTHARDLRVAVKPESAGRHLSPSKCAILAQAAVTVVAPPNVGRLASLLPLLAPGLDAIPPGSDDLTLTLTPGTGEAVATALDFVPDYVLARRPSGYLFIPVSSVRIRSDPHMIMTLTLEPYPVGAAAIDRAILTGSGRYAAVARLSGI